MIMTLVLEVCRTSIETPNNSYRQNPQRRPVGEGCALWEGIRPVGEGYALWGRDAPCGGGMRPVEEGHTNNWNTC